MRLEKSCASLSNQTSNLMSFVAGKQTRGRISGCSGLLPDTHGMRMRRPTSPNATAFAAIVCISGPP